MYCISNIDQLYTYVYIYIYIYYITIYTYIDLCVYERKEGTASGKHPSTGPGKVSVGPVAVWSAIQVSEAEDTSV